MFRPTHVLSAAVRCVALVLMAFTAARAAALPALPAPAASFDIGTIHADRYGNGARTLIFIPGLGSGPWSWAEQISRFSQGYTVYALTLDGFDGRPYTPQADLIAAFDRDFWTLLQTEHIDKPVVIGHSLGGTLGFELAVTHPDRLAGVIALDGLPVFPTLAYANDAKRAAAARQMNAIAGESHDQLVQYDTAFMKQIGTMHAELIAPSVVELAKSDPKAIAAWGAADVSRDLRPQLAQANVPILELMPYAQPSPYTQAQTLAFYQMLVSKAPQCTVDAIPGARHFAMLDQPTAVDAAITRFLRVNAR